MRKFTLFLIVILISVDALKSQNYFEQLPFPDSTDIFSLSINEQGDIFVAAGSDFFSKNGIYKSNDSGQTWEMVLSSGQLQTKDIDVDNDGNLYALYDYNHWSSNESVFKSTNNGQTWNGLYVPLGTDWENTGLFIQGLDTIFIAQEGGSHLTRLLRSYDDGTNWDTVFYRTGYSSENIVDLAFGHSGEIFMAISGFIEGNGGLFKSVDYGNTWSLFGMQGNMVNDLSYNSNGDLFIASLDGPIGWGLFSVLQGDDDIIPITLGFSFGSVVVNSSDDIFAGRFSQGAVYHSADNGISYEWLYSGINIYSSILSMYIDQQQFIYATSYGNVIYKSIQPTITSATIIEINNNIRIFPNPCIETIQGCIGRDIDGNMEFKVYYLDGKQSLSGLTKIDNGNFRINISCLKPGMYCLRIDAKKASHGIFIKQ